MWWIGKKSFASLVGCTAEAGGDSFNNVVREKASSKKQTHYFLEAKVGIEDHQNKTSFCFIIIGWQIMIWMNLSFKLSSQIVVSVEFHRHSKRKRSEENAKGE